MASLRQYEVDLSDLSDAEREAYRACELRGTDVRAYARQTERSPGTVSNLLRRARRKLNDEDDD